MVCRLIRRRVIDFRLFSFGEHAAMGVAPGGELGGFLGPMDDGCFIAPLEQAGHGCAMRAGNSKGVYGFGVMPGGDGPKRIARFAQNLAVKESRGAFGLGYGLEGAPDELRKIEERAHAQAGYGNKDHFSLLARTIFCEIDNAWPVFTSWRLPEWSRVGAPLRFFLPVWW